MIRYVETRKSRNNSGKNPNGWFFFSCINQMQGYTQQWVSQMSKLSHAAEIL